MVSVAPLISLTGDGVQGRFFSTVMAYPGAFNTTVATPRIFSQSLWECWSCHVASPRKARRAGADAAERST